jgi:hypothetical protein
MKFNKENSIMDKNSNSIKILSVLIQEDKKIKNRFVVNLENIRKTLEVLYGNEGCSEMSISDNYVVIDL